MHFSIAPVEITSHMAQQFDTAPGAQRKRKPLRHTGMRHRASVALHGIVDRPEPATSH